MRSLWFPRCAQVTAADALLLYIPQPYVAISPVKPSVIGHIWRTIAKINLFSQRAMDEVFTLCSENAVNMLALRRVARPALSSHELAKDAYVLR